MNWWEILVIKEQDLKQESTKIRDVCYILLKFPAINNVQAYTYKYICVHVIICTYAHISVYMYKLGIRVHHFMHC